MHSLYLHDHLALHSRNRQKGLLRQVSVSTCNQSCIYKYSSAWISHYNASFSGRWRTRIQTLVKTWWEPVIADGRDRQSQTKLRRRNSSRRKTPAGKPSCPCAENEHSLVFSKKWSIFTSGLKKRTFLRYFQSSQTYGIGGTRKSTARRRWHRIEWHSSTALRSLITSRYVFTTASLFKNYLKFRSTSTGSRVRVPTTATSTCSVVLLRLTKKTRSKIAKRS